MCCVKLTIRARQNSVNYLVSSEVWTVSSHLDNLLRVSVHQGAERTVWMLGDVEGQADEGLLADGDPGANNQDSSCYNLQSS